MTSQSDIWMLIGRRMNMQENAWVGKGWKCVGVKMNRVNKGSSISSSMLMEWFENDVIESVRKRCSDAMTHTLWVILSKNLVFNLALHVVLNILGVSFGLHSFFLRLKMAKLTNQKARNYHKGPCDKEVAIFSVSTRPRKILKIFPGSRHYPHHKKCGFFSNGTLKP